MNGTSVMKIMMVMVICFCHRSVKETSMDDDDDDRRVVHRHVKETSIDMMMMVIGVPFTGL